MSLKVSIVTPSFNQADFLPFTIDSVLAQSYPNIEYIIVDGLSTDATTNVLSRYRSCFSKVIQEQDLGQADAINKGILVSSGDIIGWLNSDDILYPHSISAIVHAFMENPAVEVVYGDVDYGPSPSKIESTIIGNSIEFISSFRRLSIPLPQRGCFWRRSVLAKCGFLNTSYHYVLDRDYFIRLSDCCNMIHLSRTMGLFRSHDNSKSVRFQFAWISELKLLYCSYFSGELPFAHDISHLESEVMAGVYLTCASLALKAGSPFSSIKYIFIALLTDPLLFSRSFFFHRLGLLK